MVQYAVDFAHLQADIASAERTYSRFYDTGQSGLGRLTTVETQSFLDPPLFLLW